MTFAKRNRAAMNLPTVLRYCFLISISINIYFHYPIIPMVSCQKSTMGVVPSLSNFINTCNSGSVAACPIFDVIIHEFILPLLYFRLYPAEKFSARNCGKVQGQVRQVLLLKRIALQNQLRIYPQQSHVF